MMFEHIEVGDEVSVMMTDHTRTFFDMTRYVGREKVIAVTPGTLTIPRGKFLRRNGASVARSKYSLLPPDDERDAESLRRQAERTANAKASKGVSR